MRGGAESARDGRGVVAVVNGRGGAGHVAWGRGIGAVRRGRLT